MVGLFSFKSVVSLVEEWNFNVDVKVNEHLEKKVSTDKTNSSLYIRDILMKHKQEGQVRNQMAINKSWVIENYFRS